MKRNQLIALSVFLLTMNSCEKAPKPAEWCCDNPPVVIPEAPLQGALIASKTATFSGDVINFDDQTEGNIEDRSWTFQGGVPASSTQKDPSVAYPTPGRYNVQLITKTKTSADTTTTTVVVFPAASIAAIFGFNGNIKDSGPQNIAATMPGTGVISFAENDRFNVKGNTATFDGANGLHLASNTAFDFGTNNYSVSCWVKTPSTSRMMIWQEAGKNGGGDPQSWLRLGDNTTTQQLRFHVGSVLNLGDVGRVSDDKWHHIVGIREGTMQRLYIDGVKIGEQSTTTLRVVSTPEQGFKIGFQEGSTSYSNFYNGLLDDLVVYKKALSEEEVKALFIL